MPSLIATQSFTRPSVPSGAMDFKIQYQLCSVTLSCDYRVGFQIHPQNPLGQRFSNYGRDPPVGR